MADNDKAGGPAVWLVAGEDGVYEYHREWVVEAHTTAESAAARVKDIERVGVELAAAMTIAGFGREDILPDGWIANYAGKCGDAEWTPDAKYEVRRVPLVGPRGPAPHGGALEFVNGKPAACGCRFSFSSGHGEYSDVASVALCVDHALGGANQKGVGP